MLLLAETAGDRVTKQHLAPLSFDNLPSPTADVKLRQWNPEVLYFALLRGSPTCHAARLPVDSEIMTQK